jgi:hypothetical protein
MLKQTKKSDPTDIILLLVILFFLAVSMTIALFVNEKIKGVIDNTTLNESSAYPKITSSFKTINETTVQRGFVLFFGLLIIGILVSSFMIKVNPVFIFIYIFTLAIAIFVAVYLANTYELLVSNAQLMAIASNYAMMTWVMQNIVKILLGVGALSMIIIFSKIFGGGESASPL